MKTKSKQKKIPTIDDLGVNLSQIGPSKTGKGFDIDLVGDPGKGENILQVFATHFLALADKEKCENYLEMTATDPITGKKCVVTVQRYEKRTPHQMRRQAEQENEDLKIEIKGLKAIIADQTNIMSESVKNYEKKTHRDKADI